MNIKFTLALCLLFLEKDVAAFKKGTEWFGRGFTVEVLVKGKSVCTGAIISRLWIVTSCSCVRGKPASDIYVLVVDPASPKNKINAAYQVSQMSLHPKCFDNKTESVQHDHNLGLLMLKNLIRPSGTVYPAKIPRQLTYWTPDTDRGLTFSAVGSHKVKARTPSQAIYENDIIVQHPDKCAELATANNNLIGLAMCISYRHSYGHDNCDHDIGAPISCDATLIGLLAYKDQGCGNSNSTAIATNIPMHAQWIREEVKNKTPYINL